jgi:hypothetical protein
MQVEQDKEIEQSGQVVLEESNAYCLFMYAVRSPVTRDYYLRCLRIFLNHISLLPEGTMEERCNLLHQREKWIQFGHLVALYDSCNIRMKELKEKRLSPHFYLMLQLLLN